MTIKLFCDHARGPPLKQLSLNLFDSYFMDGAPYSDLRELKRPLEAIYQLAGADEGAEMGLFGSSEEASSSLLLTSYIEVSRKIGKNHFLFASQSEGALMREAKKLPALGCLFDRVKPSSGGRIGVKEIAESLTPRTVLLSLPWVCPLTGVVQPIEEIQALCEERAILLHVNATHAVGKGDFSFMRSRADFFSIRLAPFCGLPGEALFLKEEMPFRLQGRPALNPAALFPFAQSALLHNDVYASCTETAYLRLLLEELLREKAGAEPLYGKEVRAPHIAAFCFPKISAEALAYLLYRRGIVASLGGGILPTFEDVATPEMRAASLLGFALGRDATREEIEGAASTVAECVKTLLKGSLS